MTGFQFGRKLGDWGKEEDPTEKDQVALIVTGSSTQNMGTNQAI